MIFNLTLNENYYMRYVYCDDFIQKSIIELYEEQSIFVEKSYQHGVEIEQRSHIDLEKIKNAKEVEVKHYESITKNIKTKN